MTQRSTRPSRGGSALRDRETGLCRRLRHGNPHILCHTRLRLRLRSAHRGRRPQLPARGSRRGARRPPLLGRRPQPPLSTGQPRPPRLPSWRTPPTLSGPCRLCGPALRRHRRYDPPPLALPLGHHVQLTVRRPVCPEDSSPVDPPAGRPVCRANVGSAAACAEARRSTRRSPPWPTGLACSTRTSPSAFPASWSPRRTPHCASRLVHAASVFPVNGPPAVKSAGSEVLHQSIPSTARKPQGPDCV